MIYTQVEIEFDNTDGLTEAECKERMKKICDRVCIDIGAVCYRIGISYDEEEVTYYIDFGWNTMEDLNKCGPDKIYSMML